MAIPQSSVSVINNGLALVESPKTNVHLVIGPSTRGPLNTPRLCSYTTLLETYEAGPLTKAAAYVSGRTEAEVLCYRVAPTARDATIELRTANWTGTSDISVTDVGIANSFLVVVEITTSGTIGVSGIFYKVSYDGGKTFGTPIALGTATSITLQGVQIDFGAGTASGSFSALVIPASESLYDVVVSQDPGSSSQLDIVGDSAPIDAYEPVFEILNSGTVGTTGITYRYSMDGGRTYTPVKRLGTADEVILEDRTGVSAGIKVTLSAGDVTAGDKISAKCSPPENQASDVVAALTIVDNSDFVDAYTFVHPTSNLGSLTDANTIQAGLAALAQINTFIFAVLDSRGMATDEPLSEFAADLDEEVANLDADRLAIGAGQCRITDPTTQWKLRRCVSWRAVERLIARPLNEELGNWDIGPVDDVDIYNLDGTEKVEYDARVDSLLHDARYVTLTTRKRREGVYFTRGPIMAASNSDFQEIVYRRVMDVASNVLQVVGEDTIGKTVFPDPLTGLLPEADAQRFDRRFQGALEEAVLAGQAGDNGAVVGVQVKVSRTAPVVGPNVRVYAEVRMVPVGFIGEFKGTIGFVRSLPQG